MASGRIHFRWNPDQGHSRVKRDSQTNMKAVANITSFPRRLRGHYGTASLQGRVDLVAPVIRVALASTNSSLGSARPSTTNLSVAPAPEYLVAPALPATSEGPAADAAVIQVWEGTVLGVDSDGQLMEARLHAKIGNIEDHTGSIELDYVADQDKDLVSPGAVFYLTLYRKRKRGGTIENSQELRFRRRPSWSNQQLVAIGTTADRLLAKLKASPVAK